MICRHCGKEYSDEFAYCPYCAEPKPRPEKPKVEFTELKHLTREERAKRSYKIVTFLGALLLFFSMFFVGQFIGWRIYPETVGNDVFCDKTDIFAIIFWMATIVVWVLSRWIYWLITKDKLMSKRVKKQIITDQFMVDRTSICPSCGSHNIKIYRKGYNYRKGFWLRLFNIKGGAYIAGMDSNNARCRCMNCGNDWDTGYDYRLIDK